ncbi:MAG: hypothetical protein OHK0045_12430 [Raineya sp.]
MNIQEYIESGILSIYVLGIATEEERAEVEQMAAKYPEIREELYSLQASINEYASQFELQPPKGLKERIMKSIDDAYTKNSPHLGSAEKSFAFQKYGIAASIVLLLISLFANVRFYTLWKEAERDLSVVKAQNIENDKKILALEAKYQDIENELAMVQNPSFNITYLEGLQEVAPKSYATVFWNEKKKEAFIFTNSLPQPPKGKQYQLWALTKGDGVVWDAGVFHWGKLSPVKCFEKPDKFIITLEKEGGVPKAEGKAYAIGAVKS